MKAIKRGKSALHPHDSGYKNRIFPQESPEKYAICVIKSEISAQIPPKSTIKSTFYLVCILYMIYILLCILCNSSFMGVYTLTGHFWLASTNYQKACACCTIAESGEINGKSAQSAQKTAIFIGHSAQMIGCEFMHVAQWVVQIFVHLFKQLFNPPSFPLKL